MYRPWVAPACGPHERYGIHHGVTTQMSNDEKDIAYSAEYDAYYNPVTNEWIDTKCDDPTCEFCSTRPAQPLKDLP